MSTFTNSPDESVEGLKNDIEYLSRLVEKVNDHERNIESISGMITRIENAIKELDVNYVPHIHLIVDFKKIKRSIRGDRADSISKELDEFESIINTGVETSHSLDDICDIMSDISVKIKKISKEFDVREELENRYKALERRFLREIAKGKILEELKQMKF